MKRWLAGVAALCVATPAYDPSASSGVTTPEHTVAIVAADHQVKTTAHPVLSREIGDLWFVPDERERARHAAAHADLAAASEHYSEGEFAKALTFARRAAATRSSLHDYAALYVGLSQLGLGEASDARKTLDALRERKPAGYVAVSAALASGEAAEAEGDHAAAASIYARLAAETTLVSEEILTRLGRAALASGDSKRAAEAYRRVYYEFALTDAATEAAAQLELLKDQISRADYKADLGRASTLFGAARYADARAAFERILPETGGDDRELASLRVAECDFFLGRHRQAMDLLTPFLERASRRAEARFFYLSALRETGRHDEYIAATRSLVADFPDSTWSEEALNNLGTHYILENEDGLAAQVFAELYQKFPKGQRAERAAWKAGWWSYKNGEYASTVRVFESAAQAFPRSNYRPSFLYWTARAHAKLDRGTDAIDLLRVVRTDYANSYYGRLATQQLARRDRALAAEDRPVAVAHQSEQVEAPRPPTEARIRALLGAGLYDAALNELRHVQRTLGGGPALEATIAWAYHKKGELRRAITIMRRAYPQFLTRGGEELPTEILQVIFPLTYWPSIQRHAAARGLDPYLVAALIAQESTFDPKARSAANAWGLMQIVPSTGRRLARALGIRRFSTAMLTNPETNIRMGTLHFSQLVRQFGGTYYALASYNAGETRVVRWKAERPGLEEDEFIDDIPFPETQNYVKRILGTAEDYRRLYGENGGKPIPVAASTPAPRPAPSRGRTR